MQKPIARSAGAGVVLLADGHELAALQHQPAIARRIARPKSEHRHCRAVRDRRRIRVSVCGRISGVSPNTTRISSGRARSIAALRGQHRMRGAAALGLHEDFRIGQRGARLRRHRRRIGPDHDRGRRRRAAARRREHARATSGRRSRCRTFGRAERMRVPSPAASTIARQVRSTHRLHHDGAARVAARPAPSYPSRPRPESTRASHARMPESANVFKLIRSPWKPDPAAGRSAGADAFGAHHDAQTQASSGLAGPNFDMRSLTRLATWGSLPRWPWVSRSSRPIRAPAPGGWRRAGSQQRPRNRRRARRRRRTCPDPGRARGSPTRCAPWRPTASSCWRGWPP